MEMINQVGLRDRLSCWPGTGKRDEGPCRDDEEYRKRPAPTKVRRGGPKTEKQVIHPGSIGEMRAEGRHGASFHHWDGDYIVNMK